MSKVAAPSRLPDTPSMGKASPVAAERMARLNQEVKRITNVLAARPDVERVLVFGSLARGEVHSHSDVDLIIVQRTSKRFLDRLDEMYRLLVPAVACDILVYTPEEFSRLREESRFVSRAVQEGRVVYAA